MAIYHFCIAFETQEGPFKRESNRMSGMLTAPLPASLSAAEDVLDLIIARLQQDEHINGKAINMIIESLTLINPQGSADDRPDH